MSFRPVNTPKITVDDLLPGDVILSAGAINPANPNKKVPPNQAYMQLLDYLIKKLDGGDYTHTSLYVGKINGAHQVVEATTEGVKLNPISVDVDAQVLVDAYRYQSPDGHKLGDPGWPVDPILEQAHALVGGPYSYSELLMGAVILLELVSTPQGAGQLMVELAARQFEAELTKWIDSLEGTTPMTCVQVATTSYYQAKAQPANKYGLQVKITGDREPPNPTPTADAHEFKQLQGRLQAQFGRILPGEEFPARAAGLAPPWVIVTAGSDAAPLGTSTPLDMETSPTLAIVGCLLDERK